MICLEHENSDRAAPRGSISADKRNLREHSHDVQTPSTIIAGRISLEQIAPIEGSAIARMNGALLAILVCRDEESVREFLRCLDQGYHAALHHGIVTNESTADSSTSLAHAVRRNDSRQDGLRNTVTRDTCIRSDRICQ
jgi:hypothetical protein